MSHVRSNGHAVEANRFTRGSAYRFTPAPSRRIKLARRSPPAQPAQTTPKLPRVRQRRRTRQRRVRCDCGQLAVTVLRVRVGSDPQYTIHLPLCPACLNLEQELHG